MNAPTRFPPDLQALGDLFYSSLGELGEFTELKREATPQPFRNLLAHDEHMTVTVESHWGGPVDVRVLAVHRTPTHYSRKIALQLKSTGQMVLFGLVRLNLSFLEPQVRAEIESERTPLGRVLIEHNVLRNVRLLSLWKVRAAQELAAIFGIAPDSVCYGRTALIYCNGVPAVELLEIIPPA
ncbi:MAG: hypothetical protein U0939_08415 [Pirellulales bacterium]